MRYIFCVLDINIRNSFLRWCSKYSSSNSCNALLILAFSPFGGSFVTFTEFWRTETGKAALGIELRNNRKSLWIIPSGSSAISNISCSILIIHDTARWQFCKNTHLPSMVPARRCPSAMGPWPWPKEMESHLSEKPISCANFWKALKGSDPVVSMKINGILFDVSANLKIFDKKFNLYNYEVMRCGT